MSVFSSSPLPSEMVFDLHRHLNITTTTNGFLLSSRRLFTTTAATSDERDAPMGVVGNREKEFLDARSSYGNRG